MMSVNCKRCEELNKENILKIYPKNIKKYVGNVYSSCNNWIVNIRCKKVRYFKSFNTYEEALSNLYQKNVEFNLKIKNIIYDLDDYFEVCLTQDKHTKIDKEDLDIVNEKVLHAHKFADMLFYARYYPGKSIQNDILGFTPMKHKLTIDHINGDGLDNRKKNLRIVNQSVQQMNTSIPYNATGIPNLNYVKKKRIFRASFIYNKQQYNKSFSCNKYPNARELAIEWLEQKKAEIIPENERVTRDLLQS